MKTVRRGMMLLLATLCIIIFWSQKGISQDDPAFLTITAAKDSLEILLDGQFIGKTPLRDHSVLPGPHQVVVRSPFWPAWNAQDFKETLFVTAGQHLTLHAQFRKSITLNSIPYGASVFSRGRFLGITPLRLELPDSLRLLTVEKDGYLDQIIDMATLDGFAHQMVMIPKQDWLHALQKMERDRAQKISNNRRWLWTWLAFTAGSGLAAIHFRSIGNEAYEDYLATPVPERMDDSFARSQRYDRYASISYALFELGFVLSGYFFLVSRK